MRICPHCGVENSPDARFRYNCGGVLEKSSPEDSSVSPPSAPSVTPASSVTPALLEPPASSASLASVTTAPPVSPVPTVPIWPVFIENNMPYTRQTVLKFYGKLKKIGIGLIVFGIIFLGLVFGMRAGGHIWRKMDGELLFFGLTFLFLGIFYFFLPRLMISGQKLLTDSTFRVYRFGETMINNQFFNDQMKILEINLPYTAITKVCRKGGYFCIYCENIVWIINRFTYTIGTESDLKNLLIAKCGSGVVRLKKRKD